MSSDSRGRTMQFKKLVEWKDTQDDVWWRTLKQLAELNGWTEIDADREVNVDIATAVESRNDLVEIYEHCKYVIEKTHD